MNIQYKIGALTVASLLLCACGSSTTTTSVSEESHEHALIISQNNTDALSVLEVGTAESLAGTAAANGAQLLLSDSGEEVAIINTSTVQFLAAHHEEDEEESASAEEHELPELSSLSITGGNIKVVNSNGHFSVLVDGSTQFVPYSVLDQAAPETEDVSFTVTEIHPALMLDDEHELVLAFDGANALIYEGNALEETLFACESVVSTAQNAEFVVVSCANTGGDVSYSVKVEEAAGEHTITDINLNVDAQVQWLTRANVFVGMADNTFHVLEENAQEQLEAESSFAAPTGMCTWGIDSLAADIFALTSSELAVYSHEGSKDAALALDESPNASCATLTLTAASQAVFVLDNSATKLYEIDKEEGASLYHIHGRENVSVNDVASAVSFHEVGTITSHDH